MTDWRKLTADRLRNLWLEFMAHYSGQALTQDEVMQLTTEFFNSLDKPIPMTVRVTDYNVDTGVLTVEWDAYPLEHAVFTAP